MQQKGISMKKMIGTLFLLIAVGGAIQSARADYVVGFRPAYCYAPSYVYRAPYYAAPVYAYPYYAPAPRVVYAPPVVYSPPVYYTAPVFSFNFGYPFRGHGHHFHHGRW